MSGIARSTLVLLVVSFFGTLYAPAILVEGTDAEKQLINNTITQLRAGSTRADNLFKQFDGATNVMIRCGQSQKTLFGGHGDIATSTVTIDKAVISSLKQINNPGGGGQALQSAGLGMIIIHEVLGHIGKASSNQGQVVTLVNTMPS